MGWDPSVLRKYNTTGHFRLLNQLRSELKDNPLIRPKDGQSVGEVNRSRSLIRAIEGRSSSYGRSRRSAPSAPNPAQAPQTFPAVKVLIESEESSKSFLTRLGAIEMR